MQITKDQALGVALRMLRTSAGLSLDAVAAHGVSPSYLSRVENGLVTPKPAWVELVATAIGTEILQRREAA